MSRRLFIESLFDSRLVDEHHGDIVANRVNALAFDAFERASVWLVFDFSFANLTREYFQEFLTDCHGHDLSGNATSLSQGQYTTYKTCLTYTLSMSLEFALQYACPLRANYSERHLRGGGRVRSLHANLTTGLSATPWMDKLKWVEKASAEIERMQEATVVCSQCPACLSLDIAGEGELVG